MVTKPLPFKLYTLTSTLHPLASDTQFPQIALRWLATTLFFDRIKCLLTNFRL